MTKAFTIFLMNCSLVVFFYTDLFWLSDAVALAALESVVSTNANISADINLSHERTNENRYWHMLWRRHYSDLPSWNAKPWNHSDIVSLSCSLASQSQALHYQIKVTLKYLFVFMIIGWGGLTNIYCYIFNLKSLKNVNLKSQYWHQSFSADQAEASNNIKTFYYWKQTASQLKSQQIPWH